MGWKVLLPQEIKEDARNLLISEGHTLIDGRGFEPEDVKADMLEYKPEAMIVRITPINCDIIECNPNLKVIVRHGAGIDALAKEPVDPANPLLTLDNVLIYPHIGGNTEEAAERASYHAAMGVCEIARGENPTWPIHDIDYTTAKTYTDVKKANKKPVGKYDY